MLPTMRLAEQWRRIEDELGDEWAQARLRLTLYDVDEPLTRRAAALLGPLTPARRGLELRFVAARRGDGPSPQAVARALTRLDDESIGGRLELVGSERTAAGAEHYVPSFVEMWERELTSLPPDWSDLHGEVRLDSTDYLDPGALALAPVNPSRISGATGFRFRCARRFGYGASPEMVRRCLARMDERGITGSVSVLRALSDTRPVYTQGPVWYVGGKAV
jgi:hypothetical protein